VKNIHSSIEYDKLKFPITYFFALGSPIAMFLTIRGITSIPSDFTLPTCKGLFNIFHPYDPIAYRLEPLINPGWNLPPVLLSHHKGRKRIHFELVELISKAKIVFGVFQNAITSITNFGESLETHENHTIGKLNQGRRIDYVLQHSPIEAINEYIFAFTSHVSYWSSEDTMLLILKEILKEPNE